MITVSLTRDQAEKLIHLVDNRLRDLVLQAGHGWTDRATQVKTEYTAIKDVLTQAQQVKMQFNKSEGYWYGTWEDGTRFKILDGDFHPEADPDRYECRYWNRHMDEVTVIYDDDGSVKA